MVEEMDRQIAISEQQAQAGLNYLRYLREKNNYWGAMAVPNIAPRLKSGEDLVTIMSDVLDEGARWLTQASRRGMRGDLTQSLEMLFEVTGQDWTRYGYGAAA